VDMPFHNTDSQSGVAAQPCAAMRLTAARLAAALVVIHIPCALLDAAAAGRRGADEGTCAAGACGAAPQRRLLLEGWEEATAVMKPQFFELMPVAHRRRFAHAGCGDRREWRFLWPMSLTEGWTCGDYAEGALNHDYCDTDLGYDFAAGEWLAARHACPVACGACCDVSSHCASAPNPALCHDECKVCVCVCVCVCMYVRSNRRLQACMRNGTNQCQG